MSDLAKAEECKNTGNEMFKKGKLDAAIEAYGEAIMFAPSEPVYYTNRAMCFRKKEHWERVTSDCHEALKLDDTTIKGHYLLGVALDAMQQHADGVTHLRRALELCKEKTISYKDDILRAMLLARKRDWQAAQPQVQHEIVATQRIVSDALHSHYEHARHTASGAADSELQAEEQMVHAGAAEAIEAWRGVRCAGRVPDYFCCKITMEIMLDPVTTPSGITYEKATLLEHLRKVGKFDPVTRKEMHEGQLVPNLALKEAISSYLELHPWAYEQAD